MPLFQTQYHQKVALHPAMALYLVVMRVSGKQTIDGIKTFDELTAIGRETNNDHLSSHVFMSQLWQSFYFRDYKAIMELCEKHPPPDQKRVMTTFRFFFEGVAALNMARQQRNQPKYRTIGEKCAGRLAKLKQISTYTFENKYMLVQAELHYLN